MPGGTRGHAGLRIHPRSKIGPTLLGNDDLAQRDLGGPLGEHVQEDQQSLRAPIQDPVQGAAVVAPQLTQLTLNLGAVRERQMRDPIVEQVETIDLLSSAA